MKEIAVLGLLAISANCVYTQPDVKIWARLAGTSNLDEGYAVAADPSGNCIIAGGTRGSLYGSNQGRYDLFVAKYDTRGNLLWGRQRGTAQREFAFGVTTDSSGIVVGLAATTSAQEEGSGGKKQVVVLYSYRTLMPINADWDRGIRRGLTRGFQEPVDMNVEYLDLARNEDEEYSQNWMDLLRRKYASRQIDLLLPVYSPALEFALAHRDTLFPGVPIVFCSANRDLGDRAHNEPNITGVVFRPRFDGTLRAARDLYPDTRQVLVVCGASDRDRGFRDAARRAFNKYDKELDFQYVEGLSLSQLLEKMASVGPRTVVLMLIYDKDTLGNDYMTQEVVEQLANVCPAPVFGLYDTLLGHGIVGGDLAMVETQGELAGEMAARVLQGERPSDIPVAGLATNQLMFDARQLRRWGVREDVLPEGAIVRYREVTFWERYRGYFVAGLLILVVQSVVIAALVVNRVRRRRAERALRRSRTEARQLAGRLLTAQEDERRHLAREMHDDLSQRLRLRAFVTHDDNS